MASRPKKSASTTAKSRKPTGNAKPRPLKSLSPAYRKRLQNYAKKHGVPLRQARSAARGHAPKAGLTESQKRRVREQGLIDDFARQQAAKWQGTDSAPSEILIADALRAQIKVHGLRWFQKLRRELAGYHQAYMDQPERDERGRRPSLGISMDDLEERYELPRETFAYH
jgi:hypothetical protein